MLRSMIATRRGSAPLVARLVLGLVMLPHGTQHALGWFGGYGFHGTLGWMTDTLGFPAPLAAIAIVVELLAPVALVLGLGGRLAAAGIFGLMVGAASTHLPNGFFMNWFGALAPGVEGYEYHLIALALAAVVVIEGSGALSIDRLLSHDGAGVAHDSRAPDGERRSRAA
ncbi:MAG TPA: DoxX family protein [Gemmatimonadaceae bacterium]|jgi:putative oxidoreductase|nr:DoxX family protein [Gemmatimonadaceae bacterium]